MMNTLSLRHTALCLSAGLFMMGLLVAPVQGQTPEQEIRAMMQKRDREIKAAVKPLIDNPKTVTDAQRQRAASLVNDQVDFAEMGRQALGKYWADLSQAQRTEFVEVFSTIVRSQSLADLNVYNAQVAYDQVKVDGETAYVKTTASIDDKKLTVEYLLRRKDSLWWLYDIILDEVSTVEGYARSFQTAIRKRGFDKFMESLYKKRDKIQASS